MGERQVFQPLTREDRITVVLYRIGIILSAAILAGAAIREQLVGYAFAAPLSAAGADALLYSLYGSVGLSVFFIHLYIGKFKIVLKNLYYIGLLALVALLLAGKGSPVAALAERTSRILLLLPLAGCLGFVTAKEAFCFKLLEGYILAMLMPILLLLAAGGILGASGRSAALSLVALLMVFFTLRKVFMPIAFDIGDKSAYQT